MDDKGQLFGMVDFRTFVASRRTVEAVLRDLPDSRYWSEPDQEIAEAAAAAAMIEPLVVDEGGISHEWSEERFNKRRNLLQLLGFVAALLTGILFRLALVAVRPGASVVLTVVAPYSGDGGLWFVRPHRLLVSNLKARVAPEEGANGGKLYVPIELAEMDSEMFGAEKMECVNTISLGVRSLAALVQEHNNGLVERALRAAAQERARRNLPPTAERLYSAP